MLCDSAITISGIMIAMLDWRGISMSNNITPEKLAYSIEELSALTTLSKPKIRKDIRNGKLDSLKKGSRRLILKDEAIRYLNSDDSPNEEEKQSADK
jgi:excisionase family DNA binding protein